MTRTREEVHATVLRLLADDGPAAVTHARVVEESNVSRATLYRHWPDRTALLVDAIGSERPQFDGGEPTGDLRTDLRNLLRAGANALTETQSMPWLLAMSVRAAEDPHFAVVMERIAEVHDTPLSPLFRRAIADGSIRADADLVVFQSMCFGTMFSLRFLWQRELTDDLVDTVVDTILTGIQAEPD
ncbi:MAG: TetR/AcrR family transcriptional regulator [Actinomycetota bacterium]